VNRKALSRPDVYSPLSAAIALTAPPQKAAGSRMISSAGTADKKPGALLQST
jgi:hypothetical protein